MSVFRELFVELPIAVLEGALKQRLPKDEPKLNFTVSASPPRDIWMTALNAIVKWRDFSWDFVEVLKDERFDRVYVIVRLDCGHHARFSLDESDQRLYGSPRDVFDHILEQLEDRPRRRCYCVQYEPPVRCTPGVCK